MLQQTSTHSHLRTAIIFCLTLTLLGALVMRTFIVNDPAASKLARTPIKTELIPETNHPPAGLREATTWLTFSESLKFSPESMVTCQLFTQDQDTTQSPEVMTCATVSFWCEANGFDLQTTATDEGETIVFCTDEFGNDVIVSIEASEQKE